jgi:hypothetical protein
MSSPSPVNNSQSSGNSPNSTANSTPNANSNSKSTIQVKLVLLGKFFIYSVLVFFILILQF